MAGLCSELESLGLPDSLQWDLDLKKAEGDRKSLSTCLFPKPHSAFLGRLSLLEYPPAAHSVPASPGAYASPRWHGHFTRSTSLKPQCNLVGALLSTHFREENLRLG